VRFWSLVGCVIVASACGRTGLAPGQAELTASGSGGFAGTPVDTGGNDGKAPLGGGGRAAGGAGNQATAGFPAAGSDSSGGEAGAGGEAGEPCLGDGSVERCNGIDDDCNGVIDDGLPLVAQPGPITVRSNQGRTDVGLNFDCDSCGWAWDPQLVETEDGLAVLWFLGIWGGSEQPSAFYRRLTSDLEPVGDVSSLGPEYWMGTLRRGALTPAGTVLLFAERVGNLDVPSFSFIDRQLSVTDAVPLDGCPGVGWSFSLAPLAPRVVSCLGENFIRLFQLDERKPQVVVASRSQDLRLAGETNTSAAGPARGAVRKDRGLVAMTVRLEPGSFSNVLWTLEISPSGQQLAEPRRQLLEVSENVVLEALLDTDDGYLLFAHRYTAGLWPTERFTVRLAPDGSLEAAPTPYASKKSSYWDDFAVIPVGSGFVAASTQEFQGVTVQQLDANGKVWNEVVALAEAYSPPALLFSRGQLYVAFTESPRDGTENRVLLQRFSCEPKLAE
jgi:hypothetical protein